MTCYHRLPRFVYSISILTSTQLSTSSFWQFGNTVSYPNQKPGFPPPPSIMAPTIAITTSAAAVFFYSLFDPLALNHRENKERERGIGNRHPCCLCGIITRLLSLYHRKGYNFFLELEQRSMHTHVPYSTLLYLCVCVCVCIYPSSFFFFSL